MARKPRKQTQLMEPVTLLRMPEAQAKKLRKAARRDGLSINKFASLVLEDYLDKGRQFDGMQL